MATNAPVNIDVLERVATVLGDVVERSVFVGGAVVSIYADDPAAMDARPTFDIDLAVSVATASELEELRQRLVASGFTQRAEDKVVCRFRVDGIMVDIMALEAVGWAPGNRWYLAGFPLREVFELPSGRRIHVLPLAFYLASKFDAHADRGSDPRSSRDIEDIVHVLDNSLDIPDSLKDMETAVRSYLSERLRWLFSIRQKETVAAHMPFAGSEVRYQRMKEAIAILLG